MIQKLIHRRFIWVLLFGLGILPARASAPDSVRFDFDFDFAIDTTGWLNSANASQLFRIPVTRTGRAGIGTEAFRGEFAGFNAAETFASIEAGGESWFRLSPRTMLYGYASFESVAEKNSNGSAFMNREERAFDIILMDPENKGSRKTEWYRIGAAVGHEINSRIALGLRMNYHAGNMARTRDLRHTNKTLDMDVSPGATLRLSKSFQTGLHYTYKRYIEGVGFKTFGTTDQQYFTLIDFGGFWGKQEIFGSGGYTAKESATPYVENLHEIGWQVEYRPVSSVSIFHELLIGSGDGYYGKKSSASIVYTEHDLTRIGNHFLASVRGEKYRHHLNLYFGKYSLTNYENSWRSETASSGNTVIEYYGKNEVGTRDRLSIAGDYALEWGNTRTRPLWRVFAGGAYEKRDIRAVIYPYFRKQHLQTTEMHIGTLHKRMLGRVELASQVKVGFLTGGGDRNQDGTVVPPSSENGKPVSSDYYLDCEYNYLTASRIVPEVNIRATFPIRDIGCFAGCGYRIEQSLGTANTGGNRQGVNVSLGVNF